MSAQDKKVRIDISLEAAEALKEINRLNEKLDKLNIEIGKATKGTQEYDEINKKLVSTQNQLSNTTKANTNSINANASSHSNSTNAINAEIQRLQALQKTLDVTSQEYADTTAAIGAQSNRMNQATAATGGTTSAALELGRVVSDMPYGIRGVANNLSQFTNQMFYATRAAGSLGLALKGLVASLWGPLGIILAVQGAIAALDFFAGSTEKAEEEADGLDSTLSGLARTLDGLELSQKDVNARMNEYVELLSLKSKIDKEDKILSEKRILNSEEMLKAQQNIDYQRKQMSDEENSPQMRKNAEKFFNAAVARLEMLKTKEQSFFKQSLDNNKKYLEEKDKIGRGGDGTLLLLNQELSVLKQNREAMSTNNKLYLEQTDKIIAKEKEIQAITGEVNKPKGSNKNKSAASFKESNIQLEKDAQKHYNNMLQLLIAEEDKQLEAKQKAEREELDAQVALFVKEEEISYNAYVKKQEQRILDNATNKFIVDDANRLIAEAKVTHDGVIEESEIQHQATMTNLKGVQAVESIKLTNKLAEDKEEHNRRMRDLDLELSAIVIEDGRVFQRYILDEQIANQEADLEVLQSKLDSTAYMESLSYDERLALKEKFNEESLALEEMNAARAMSIEEAKQSMTEATWELATKGMMSASKLAKKGSDEEKALALLSIAAGTAEGLINGIVIAGNTAKASPGPAAPFIYGAMVAAQTASVLGAAAQAKSILNGGSASSSSAASSSATVESFSPNFNVVGNSNENQLAQSISNQTNSPVQAYVVYEDIAEAESVTQQSIESSGI